jgi:hypothetical protein
MDRLRTGGVGYATHNDSSASSTVPWSDPGGQRNISSQRTGLSVAMEVCCVVFMSPPFLDTKCTHHLDSCISRVSIGGGFELGAGPLMGRKTQPFITACLANPATKFPDPRPLRWANFEPAKRLSASQMHDWTQPSSAGVRVLVSEWKFMTSATTYMMVFTIHKAPTCRNTDGD